MEEAGNAPGTAKRLPWSAVPRRWQNVAAAVSIPVLFIASKVALAREAGVAGLAVSIVLFLATWGALTEIIRRRARPTVDEAVG